MASTTANSEFIYDEDIYRDSIATVDKQGKRIWLFPKAPKGMFHNYRKLVAWFLLISFMVIPWIRIGGVPIIQMNILERRFILFGNVFLPQDFHLFALALIIFFLFIILFTVVFGRIWCGWICPQTLFMEFVFRKLEYWIEGDFKAQKRIKDQAWDAEKIRKRTIKYVIFMIISLIVGHTAMMYIIGSDEVIRIVQAGPVGNVSGFLGSVAFTLIFFGVFTYMREQVCIAFCPYGRLQGVLLGKDSIAVMYDWLRGEPRGKIRKTETQEEKGDCIDCKLCVAVCPTGIDIRNGTQLECINCTACMDACDDVMEKVNKPKGLIRMDSYNAVKNNTKWKFTPRIAAYSVVLVALLGIQAYLLTGRTEVEATVLRVPGTLYQENEDGSLSNLYNAHIVNKTFEDMELIFKLKDSEKGKVRMVGKDVVVPASGNADAVFFVDLNRAEVIKTKNTIYLEVYSKGELKETVKTNFTGPVGGFKYKVKE